MKRQSGITLVEVLVSLLILGVGVLGFIGMQMRALGSSSEAYERAQAAAIASDFVERMSAQMSYPPKDVVTSKLYTRDKLMSYYNTQSLWAPWGTTEVRDNTCLLGSCNLAQMAAYDIKEVRFYAARLLPNGQTRLGTCPDRVAAANASLDMTCFYIAWGDTTPTVGTAAPHCIDANANYVNNARCLLMRVY